MNLILFNRESIQEEDSSSSTSSSRFDQALLSNPIFHSSGGSINSNRKLAGYSLANTISKRNMILNSSGMQGARLSSSSATSNTDLMQMIGSGGANKVLPIKTRTKTDKNKGFKKPRLANDFAVYEDNDNARNDFYQSDENGIENETGDEENTEVASETATTDNEFENDDSVIYALLLYTVNIFWE